MLTSKADLLERARDREMFLSAIREIVDSVNRTADAQLEQAKFLQRFFDYFITVGAPTSRVLTDEGEFELEMEQRGES